MISYDFIKLIDRKAFLTGHQRIGRQLGEILQKNLESLLSIPYGAFTKRGRITRQKHNEMGIARQQEGFHERFFVKFYRGGHAGWDNSLFIYNTSYPPNHNRSVAKLLYYGNTWGYILPKRGKYGPGISIFTREALKKIVMREYIKTGKHPKHLLEKRAYFYKEMKQGFRPMFFWNAKQMRWVRAYFVFNNSAEIPAFREIFDERINIATEGALREFKRIKEEKL